MMLGVSSNDGVSGMAEQPHESGSSGGGVDESERSGGGGGNRWPRQETLALLKIRSDMDVAFRDSSLKGPLWEEVSRKMAELGFQRNAKKCKEKFENVYKYHKRTKDGRSSKPDGKSYRFFDQLEALENSPPISFAPPPRALATEPLPTSTNSPMPPQHISTTTTTVSSTNSPNPLSVARPPPSHTAAVPQTTIANNLMNPTLFQPTISQPPPPPPPQLQNNPLQTHTFQPASHQHILNNPLSNSTSSSTSSDEDIQRRRGKKRKWKDFFGRLMKDVIEKQEELQNKFLETLEKRERDRNAREEAWRVQEMARMNREHDLLVQERSIAAAKDAAVIAFLQKVTDQNNLQIPINNNSNAAPAPPPPQVMQVQQQQQQQQHRIENPQQASRKSPPPPTSIPAPAPTPTPIAIPAPPILTMVTPPTKTLDVSRSDNGGDGFTGASSSRWPKSEVEALIKLRTDLELKYQENGPKGPLWEEISSAMRKLGYNRSSKRCKEKWENINKYFKKVKESNKKRPEDSKTCPYFHQLDAIYKERAKNDVPSFNYTNPGMVPIMAQPEQQWPLPVQQQQQHQQRQHDTVMRDLDHEDSEDNDHEDDDEGDEEEDEDDDQGRGYEIVTNKPPSSVTNAVE